MYRISVFITLFLIFYNVEGRTKWTTATYTPKIKTLRILANNDFLTPPVILLHSGQQINISFDELGDEPNWISYRIIHCDADWRPSQLSELDYLDGFNQVSITETQSSFNTFISYYHYSVNIPNENINLRLSGNYAVLFYYDENPDQIIASACFSVMEMLTDIQGSILTNTDLGFNREYQQVEVRLAWKNNFTGNPAQDLKVVVSQNNRIDNEVTISHPTRFSANTAFYEHNRALIFEAGNNYRRFDISSNKYPGIGVEQIRFFDPMYHVLLTPTVPRADQPFFYDRDQNGRFLIRQVDAEENDIEADYFMVHFMLEDDNPFIEGKLYLEGDFLHHRFDESNQLIYNFEQRRYEVTMLLKQGHYNYQYLFVPNNNSQGSPALIEGNFYETENEYLVKVYFRPPNQRYDRLIGATLIKTN